MTAQVTNKAILESLQEQRTLLNTILHRKASQIRHFLRRNCLRHDVIEGQTTEVKEVGRKIMQFLNDLTNRRRYWEQKEEADEKKSWKKTVYHMNPRKK